MGRSETNKNEEAGVKTLCTPSDTMIEREGKTERSSGRRAVPSSRRDDAISMWHVFPPPGSHCFKVFLIGFICQCIFSSAEALKLMSVYVGSSFRSHLLGN